MKLIKLLCIIICLPILVNAQQSRYKLVYTSDIDHFWEAYDSLSTTTDTIKQVDLISRLYVDRGTPGLKAFMKARNYNAVLWVKLIHQYPKFWKSIRANTESVKRQVPAITNSIGRFRKLYPEMRPAKMYFTVGGLRSGGTTMDDMVLVGTEIATADRQTDASELSDWLKNVFKEQQRSNLVALNVHEYVHTQQKGGDRQLLLAHAIMEGAADLIAELVIGKQNNNTYMVYGRAHEQELKEKFRLEMLGSATQNWLYNGTTDQHPDLGYFMGYEICKSYYQHDADKKKAIKTILELDFSNEELIIDFLKRSRYYTQPINRSEIIKEYDKLRPVVSGLSPDINGRKEVSSSITELTINFSEPMGEGYSINLGEGGKEHFPITGVVGFTDDRKAFKLKLQLQAGRYYNFVITDRSFKSKTGYPLKPYTVQFDVK